MSSIGVIETQARDYSIARSDLAVAVATLQESLEQLKRKHLPVIKRRVAAAKEAEAKLRAAIEENPDLFRKPRSLVLHGIRLGYRKATGKIEWEDADQVVKLVRKHFPEQADVLIVTTEKPSKEALAQLAAADLKKLGITVAETGDVVFVKDTTSDIDKLVTALLEEEEEEAQA